MPRPTPGPPRAIIGVGALCALLSALPTPAWTAPPADAPGAAVAVAELQQQALPALQARISAARARIDAAEGFFRGDLPLGAAWPGLDAAPLGEADWRRGERARLERAAVLRAAERVAPLPPALPPDAAPVLRQAQAAATEAEARADALEAQLLDGLDAGLARAPGLAEPSLGRRLTALDAEARLPEGASPGPAARAAAQAAALRAWRSAAVHAMVQPDSTALQALVDAALAAAPPLGPVGAAEGESEARALQDRLVRVLPLLPRPDAAAAWIAAADAALYPDGAPALSAPRSTEGAPSLDERAALLENARKAAAEAAAALAADDPALTPGARRALKARAQAAAAEHSALEAELSHARALASAGIQPRAEGPDLDAVDRLAAEARALAAGAAEGEAALRAHTAALRERVAQDVRQEDQRRNESLNQIAALQTELDAALAALGAALARPSLDPDRQPAVDRAYLELRRIAALLAGQAEQAALRRGGARQEPDPPWRAPAGADPAAVAELRAAEADLRATRGVALQAATEEQDALVGLLIEAKGGRRVARGEASVEAQRAGQRAFIPELVHELGETWLVVQARSRALRAALQGLPGQLADLTALLALLKGSIEGILGLVLWWGLRQGLPMWALRGMNRLQGANNRGEDGWARAARALRAGLTPGDLRLLSPPLTVVGLGALDAAAVLLVASFAGEQAPFVAPVAIALSGRAAWRATPGLIALLLGAPEGGQPAVSCVEASVRLRALRGLRAGVLWAFGDHFIGALLVGLLAADRAGQLADALGLGLGLALGLALLWSWGPALQAACAHGSPSAALRWASRPAAGLDRLPRAALALVLLGSQVLGGALSERLTTHSRLRWIGAVLARRRYAKHDATSAPPSVELAAALAGVVPGPPPSLPPAIAALGLNGAAPGPALRPGAYAIIGDRGAGLDGLPAALTAMDPGLCTLRPPARLRGAEAALGWIGAALGCPDASPEALQAHLLERGGAVLLLDGHRLLLRTVGGFDALRAILELMQATSERCTWICALRAPTWSFLRGAPEAVDLSVFRRVAALEPVGAEALGAWLLPALSAAGLRARFGTLAAHGERSTEARAEARARAGYLRLLEDLSQGNPLVAEGLWRASHRAGAAADDVEHALPALPAAQALATLGDEDLFLLTALAVHGGLTVAELAEVLNRPAGAVQAACRRLCGEQITHIARTEPRTYAIEALVLPQVLRILRHRAFLQTA